MIYVKQLIDEFTYSNIVETVSAWSPTTNYLVGQKARVGSYIYVSTYGTVTLPNINKPPLTNLGLSWIKLENEPSNTYACLDPYEETKTTWVADGILEFKRGAKDTLGIGNFTATQVKIEYRNDAGDILDEQTYTYSINTIVFEHISYTYAPVTTSTARVIYLPLKRKGTKIRVIFSRGGLSTDCGYIIAGIATNMGKTLNTIQINKTQIGSKIQKTYSFTTTTSKETLMLKSAEADTKIDTPMMFIVDETETSSHQNLVVIGTIQEDNPTAENATENQTSWQIKEIILE